MTENTQAVDVSSQNQTSLPQSVSSAPVSAPVQPQEKLLKQSEVNDLVGRVKHESYEKGKSEALASQANTQAQPTQQSQQNMGGISQTPPEQLRALVQEQFQQQQQGMYWQNTLNQLAQHTEETKKRFPDFVEKVSTVDYLNKEPDVLYLATEHGKYAPDMLYDLANNPTKLAIISNSIANKKYDLARMQMTELATSVKQNLQASEQSKSNEPLSQVKPSNVGMDNGSQTVRDLRKQPWLKA